MKKILQFNYHELWPSEYVEMYKQIIAITEKHNPQILHLNKALERVKRHLADVDKLRLIDDGLSKRVIDLDNRRDNLTMSLYNMALLWSQTNLPEMAKNGQIIIDWMNNHHYENLPFAAYSHQTELTDQMLIDAKASPEISAAINGLSMEALVNELKSVNTYFDYHFKKFKATGNSAEEYTNFRKIRYQADMDLRGLFSYIEMYQNSYYFAKLDYQPLVEDLNELLNSYKDKLDKRIQETERTMELNPNVFNETE